MRKLVINKNTKFLRGQYYTFATDQDFIKWAVLPYAEINADGNPYVEFTPTYFQAKDKGIVFKILDQDSKIMENGEITTSIWLPKQCWTLYGTPKKEVTLKIDSSNGDRAFPDLKYDID